MSNTATTPRYSVIERHGLLMSDSLIEVYVDYTYLSAGDFVSILRAIDGLHTVTCQTVTADVELMPRLFVDQLMSGSSWVRFRQGLRFPKMEYPEEQLTLVLPRWMAVPYIMTRFLLIAAPTAAGAVAIHDYLTTHPEASIHEQTAKTDFRTDRLSDPNDPIGKAAGDLISDLYRTLDAENILQMKINGVTMYHKEREDTDDDRPRPPKRS